MIMVRISWSKSLLGWVHQYFPETSAIHGMETSRVSQHQKIQDINQLWETDGDCVWDMQGVLLLHFTPPNETVNSAAYQATLK